MTKNIKENLNDIVVAIVMIPLIPVVLALAMGTYLTDSLLSNDERYELHKKW